MFPLYLQYLLTDFRQTFVTGAPWDTDDLVTFLGQKVKVQGHTIAAELPSSATFSSLVYFVLFVLNVVVSSRVTDCLERLVSKTTQVRCKPVLTHSLFNVVFDIAVNAVCLQAGRILSTCFSSDMSVLSVFAEDNASDSAGVRLLMVSCERLR